MKAITKTNKLEDSKLWHLASVIAEEAYSVLDEFPEEEKWGMQNHLRQAAFDLTSDIAEAEGTFDPRDGHYSFSRARKSAFALKNIYKLAHKTELLTLNPDAMVNIDRLVALIDAETEKSDAAIKKWYESMESKQKDQK
jgi:four helix bundle protein